MIQLPIQSTKAHRQGSSEYWPRSYHLCLIHSISLLSHSHSRFKVVKLFSIVISPGTYRKHNNWRFKGSSLWQISDRLVMSLMVTWLLPPSSTPSPPPSHKSRSWWSGDGSVHAEPDAGHLSSRKDEWRKYGGGNGNSTSDLFWIILEAFLFYER